MDYSKIENIVNNSELYTEYKNQLNETKQYIDGFNKFIVSALYDNEIDIKQALSTANDNMRKCFLLIANIEASIYKIEELFTKITLNNNISKKEANDFLEIKQISETMPGRLEDIKTKNDEIKNLVSKEKTAFKIAENRQINDSIKVLDENYKMVIDKYNGIKTKLNQIEQKIGEIKPLNNGEDISYLQYETIKTEDGVPVIEGTTFNGLEKLVDQPLGDNISIDDFAMVHVTDYYPENHTIRTPKNIGATQEEIINGKKMELKHTRNTVHFAINGIVGDQDHQSEESTNTNFIIIEPLKTHVKELDNFSVFDTWKTDNVNLSEKAILLVTEEAYNTLSEKQKQEYNIIKYKGDSTICVQKLLIMMGIKPQTVGSISWKNENNERLAYNFIEETYNIHTRAMHYRSKQDVNEKAMYRRNRELSTIRNQEINITDTGLLDLTKEEIIELLNSSLYDGYSPINPIPAIKSFLRDYGIYYKNGRYNAYSATETMNEPLNDEELEKMAMDLLNYQKELETDSPKQR